MELEQKNKEADDLGHQLKLEKCAVTRLCHDDTLISFYTGFQSMIKVYITRAVKH